MNHTWTIAQLVLGRLIAMLTLLFLAALGVLGAQEAPRVPAPGHWPQWRGPNRDNVSTETALLKEWPEGGPPRLWKTSDLGSGVGGVAVAGGLIFLMGYREDAEYLSALDGDGKLVWSRRIGPLVGENVVMRWLSQRTPLVDDDRVYAVTGGGVLECLSSLDGRVGWSKDYRQDLEGTRAHWGFCDFPLVDGSLLVCTPGGPKNTVVALDKADGRKVWSCPIPSSLKGTHSTLIAAELAGVRQYVHQLDAGTVGISPSDGKLLWTYPLPYTQGNVHSAVPFGKDGVFTLSPWGVGSAVLRIEKEGEGWKAIEVARNPRQPFDSWIGNTLRVEDRLLSMLGGVQGFDLQSGKPLFSVRLSLGRPTVTYADGRLYLRGMKGEVLLLEVTETDARTISRFDVAQVGREPAWTFPVVAGGRLYLRDQGELSCYDVRGPGYRVPAPVWNLVGRAPAKPPPSSPEPPPKPLSDAVFVPTPQDVVERMLKEARVSKEDVVYDLGSGDGRIVLAASRTYGCKAVGYEIDPELVRLSRDRVREIKVGALVSIEEKDLFTADLGPATVVTLYLGAKNNERLLPQLRQLKAGARIVSHAHLLGEKGPKPDQEVRLTSQEDGVEHTIYLWTAPLREAAGK